MRPDLALVVGVATALALTACGSAEQTSVTTSPTPTDASEGSETTSEPVNDLQVGSSLHVASGDFIDVGGVDGFDVEPFSMSSATIMRCAPVANEEESLWVIAFTEDVRLSVLVNVGTLTNHTISVYERGIGTFDGRETSDIPRKRWFVTKEGGETTELEAPFLIVDGSTITASTVLTAQGDQASRSVDFSLSVPAQIESTEACQAAFA